MEPARQPPRPEPPHLARVLAAAGYAGTFASSRRSSHRRRGISRRRRRRWCSRGTWRSWRRRRRGSCRRRQRRTAKLQRPRRAPTSEQPRRPQCQPPPAVQAASPAVQDAPHGAPPPSQVSEVRQELTAEVVGLQQELDRAHLTHKVTLEELKQLAEACDELKAFTSGARSEAHAHPLGRPTPTRTRTRTSTRAAIRHPRLPHTHHPVVSALPGGAPRVEGAARAGGAATLLRARGEDAQGTPRAPAGECGPPGLAGNRRLGRARRVGSVAWDVGRLHPARTAWALSTRQSRRGTTPALRPSPPPQPSAPALHPSTPPQHSAPALHPSPSPPPQPSTPALHLESRAAQRRPAGPRDAQRDVRAAHRQVGAARVADAFRQGRAAG